MTPTALGIMEPILMEPSLTIILQIMKLEPIILTITRKLMIKMMIKVAMIL